MYLGSRERLPSGRLRTALSQTGMSANSSMVSLTAIVAQPLWLSDTRRRGFGPKGKDFPLPLHRCALMDATDNTHCLVGS